MTAPAPFQTPLGIGIDPGAKGAIAAFDGRVLRVHDMPTVSITRNGKGKQEVSPELLAAIVKRELDMLELVHDDEVNPIPPRVLLEHVGARPNQGVSSMFQFGRSTGMIEGVLAASGLPYQRVVPQVWQKAMAVRGGKDGARARAIGLFPRQAELFERKKDDGRADAALLAYMAYHRGVN